TSAPWSFFTRPISAARLARSLTSLRIWRSSLSIWVRRLLIAAAARLAAAWLLLWASVLRLMACSHRGVAALVSRNLYVYQNTVNELKPRYLQEITLPRPTVCHVGSHPVNMGSIQSQVIILSTVK